MTQRVDGHPPAADDAPQPLNLGVDGVDPVEERGYWRENVRIIWIALAVWFLCSFGFGILLRPMLSGIRIGGTDLGFWFAQQGSIIVFLVLIFTYAAIMNGVDRKHHVEE